MSMSTSAELALHLLAEPDQVGVVGVVAAPELELGAEPAETQNRSRVAWAGVAGLECALGRGNGGGD